MSLEGTEVGLGTRRYALPDGHGVILGIRPEHVALDPSGREWPVEVVELLGSETLIHAGRTGAATLTLRLANGAPVGEAVRVSFPPEHLHLFDRATGLRLDPA